jgi:hypothetical protein
LLGFELAVEGFEDPVLEDCAIAGLYVAEGETQTGWADIKDYSFGFEGFTGVSNFQEHMVLFFEGGRGFEEAALQAQFGHTSGENRFGRAIRSDFGSCVERKT